MGAKKPFL